MNLTLNNQQRLICHKIQTTNQPITARYTIQTQKIKSDFCRVGKNQIHILSIFRRILIKTPILETHVWLQSRKHNGTLRITIVVV